MHIMLKPNALTSVQCLFFTCDCLITIYTHGFDFWSSSTPARDILTHGCCSVRAHVTFWYLGSTATSLDSPLGFLDLDLLSCPCFIFSFIFIIRQLLLHQSCACQIACWCLEDLWTKQTKVPVLMEFVGSKSWFCTKYFFEISFVGTKPYLSIMLFLGAVLINLKVSSCLGDHVICYLQSLKQPFIRMVC